MIDFNYLELHLTDHCNLNCAKCSHYAPIAEPFYYEFSQFRRDLMQLALLCSKKSTEHFILRLMGGEPLLQKDLLEYVEAARIIFPKAEIWVVSNGLKLLELKDNYFIERLNQLDITFQFTNYKGSPNYNNEIILNQVKKINKHEILEHSGFFGVDFNFKNSTHDHFELCTDNYQHLCTILKGQKLYKCAMEAYNFNLVNKFNIKFPLDYHIEDNELDIYSCTYDDIINFLNTPSTLCKYCNWTYDQECTPWKQSEQKLSEWVKEI